MDVPRSSERIWLLLVFVTAASCQQSVGGVVGRDVLLPCVCGPVDKLPALASVYWRWEDDVNVYDIILDVSDLQNQAPRFKTRVSSFPELYRTGNFSVLLRDVQLDDSGSYKCHVPSLDALQRVELSVTGEVTEPDREADAGNRLGNRSGSIAVRLHHLTLLLFLLLGQSVFCEN